MDSFRQMTNDCIRIGLRDGVSSIKRLSARSYGELKRYDEVPTYYRLGAISRAAGILSSRKKSLNRGYQTRNPHMTKLVLISCYGFKIAENCLIVPVGERARIAIPLNAHTLEVLSNPALKVRSFTLTERFLSLCISKEIRELEPSELASTVGVDRNLRNITAGNSKQVVYYDISKAASIANNTRSIISSFRRNDARIRRQISSKYGRRKNGRVRWILHQVSKDIVQNARANKDTIIFEEIKDIRNLYRKGNSQSRKFRGLMNSAPFGEIKRQVEYKAAWEGLPARTLTKGETRGTTRSCYRCGERLQGNRWRPRELWCKNCKRWFDRDLVAVMNISRRGWVRFAHSKGGAGEAVKGNPEHGGEPVILRVDASKPGIRRQPKT